MHLIVYLHGFRSSPRSSKAELSKTAVAQLQVQGVEMEWYCPQLPPSPLEAMNMVQAYIDACNYSEISIMGSSLGGYYATYLGERYFSKVSLLNPAIEPARDLEKYIGEQTSWHTEDSFYFKPEYIQELKDLYVTHISHPDRYFLLAAKGDEVLDWREMVAKYSGAHQLVFEGGDHAISNYQEYLPKVLAFHGLQGPKII